MAIILPELEPSENVIRSRKQAYIYARIDTYTHTN